MTKRDILDVRTKHAGGRPRGSHTKENKRILTLIERELERRRKWGQRQDDNPEIAAAVAGTPRDYREARGRNAETERDHSERAANEPYAGSFRIEYSSVPGLNAGWRIKSEFWAEGYDDSLEREIAARLSTATVKIAPSDLDKYPERVIEELDKLLNDPKSRASYFEYDPDFDYDTRDPVHSLGAVVGHVKRYKDKHPEFKTRKRGASKAKSPKP